MGICKVPSHLIFQLALSSPVITDSKSPDFQPSIATPLSTARLAINYQPPQLQLASYHHSTSSPPHASPRPRPRPPSASKHRHLIFVLIIIHHDVMRGGNIGCLCGFQRQQLDLANTTDPHDRSVRGL